MKTASRILGTAGFLAGYHCQDSPVYGAERRGAAVTAYTRINTEPVLERGVIDHPDLIVLADETLLNDSAAGVLIGQDAASAIYLNVDSASAAVDSKQHCIQPRVLSYDVTSRTRDVLGRPSALSAGLGAAAARIVGVINEEQLIDALREEFETLGLTPDDLEKNIRIAREVFAALPAIEFQPSGAVPVETMADVTYSDPVRGAPSVLAAGNAELRNTGAWRVERPVIDRNLCTRCGLCFVQCPDGAISLDEEGYPVIDYDHCKGCMICRRVCPIDAITREKETKAW